MGVDDVPAMDSTPDDSFDIAFVSVRSLIVEQKDCSLTRKSLLTGERRTYDLSKYETSTEPKTLMEESWKSFLSPSTFVGNV